MTPADSGAQPHPLRCETCGHHHLVGRIPDIDECDILNHTPTEVEKKLIRQIGCASHSSAPARERPKYPQTCDMSKWTPEEIANRLQCAYDKGVREAQQPPAPAASSKECVWSEDEDRADVYHTGCGNAFEFTVCGPKENHFKFCPYCGAALRERGEATNIIIGEPHGHIPE